MSRHLVLIWALKGHKIVIPLAWSFPHFYGFLFTNGCVEHLHISNFGILPVSTLCWQRCSSKLHIYVPVESASECLALVVPEGEHNHPSWLHSSETISNMVLLWDIYQVANLELIKPNALKTGMLEILFWCQCLTTTKVSMTWALLDKETFESQAPVTVSMLSLLC